MGGIEEASARETAAGCRAGRQTALLEGAGACRARQGTTDHVAITWRSRGEALWARRDGAAKCRHALRPTVFNFAALRRNGRLLATP